MDTIGKPVFDDCIRAAIALRKEQPLNISILQRKLRIDFTMASRVMDGLLAIDISETEKRRNANATNER